MKDIQAAIEKMAEKIKESAKKIENAEKVVKTGGGDYVMGNSVKGNNNCQISMGSQNVVQTMTNRRSSMHTSSTVGGSISIVQKNGKTEVHIGDEKYTIPGVNQNIAVINGVLHLDGKPYEEIIPEKQVTLNIVIEGDIEGDFSVSSDSGSVSFSCESVKGDAKVGGNLTCKGDVGGSVEVQGNLECENISQGPVTTHGDMNCGNITGNVEVSGDLECESIKGNVEANSDVKISGSVEGDLTAEGDVRCLNVTGDLKAGGDVRASGNVEGNVESESDVQVRGNVGGDIVAEGGVSR